MLPRLRYLSTDSSTLRHAGRRRPLDVSCKQLRAGIASLR